MNGRRRTLMGGWTLVVVSTLLGCGQAAAVFFDIPPKTSAPPPASSTAPTDAPPAGLQAPGSTVRPPIESTLNPDSAIALLPKAATGEIDWVGAIHDGVIRPRAALPGDPPPPDRGVFKFDFVLKGPNEMFDARFPHSSHIEMLACESCHPTIFRYRNEPISMQSINQGEACGRCHGKVAFAPTSCSRCHTAMPASAVEPQFLGTLVMARSENVNAVDASRYPPSTFPHWVHRVRYQCSACHQGLFTQWAGTDTLTMETLRAGEACGACHDGRNAFGQFECGRCHVPKEGSADSS